MVKEMSEKISVDFAVDLLTSLYHLDLYMGEISEVIDQLADCNQKNKLKQALSGLMYVILNDLMVPIYHQHQSLGTASEPGSWLKSRL